MEWRRAPRFPLSMPLAFLAAFIASASGVLAGQQLTSTPTRTVGAVMEADGVSIQPVGINPASSPEDLAPQQLFEIVRPDGKILTIGRMFTSCSCIRLEADARSFQPGEKATLRLRNIEATPPAGQTYSFFVQVTSPVKTTLRYDTFIQSSQFIPSDDESKPTRGNIIADGVLDENMLPPAVRPSTSASPARPSVRMGSVIVPGELGADDDSEFAEEDNGPLTSDDNGEEFNFEIIIPKAENYVPDTSEYTLGRKGADEDAPQAPATPEAPETPEKPTASASPETPQPAPVAAPAPASAPEPAAVRETPVAAPAPATPVAPVVPADPAAPVAPPPADPDDSLWQEVRPRTRLTPALQ